MIEYNCNFKKYSTDLKRMALFSRKLDDNTLEITEFQCSKDDTFNKKFAHEEYLASLPEMKGLPKTKFKRFNLPLQAHSAKFTLNKYANENYYNLVTQVVKWEKDDDKHITKLEFNPHKKTLIAKTLSK